MASCTQRTCGTQCSSLSTACRPQIQPCCMSTSTLLQLKLHSLSFKHAQHENTSGTVKTTQKPAHSDWLVRGLSGGTPVLCKLAAQGTVGAQHAIQHNEPHTQLFGNAHRVTSQGVTTVPYLGCQGSRGSGRPCHRRSGGGPRLPGRRSG